MQAVYISPDKARADYERFLRVLGIDSKNHIVTPKILRAEKELRANNNSYRFDLIENNASDRPLEEKLDRNSMFAITHVRLGIAKQNKVAEPAQYANYKVFTTNDANYFTGAGEATSLAPVYNGKMGIRTDNVERLQDFLTSMLEYIPERGYINFVAPQVADEFPMVGTSLDEKGFFALTPQIIISGDQQNDVLLTLGQGNISAIAGDPTADETNVLVLELAGFHVANIVQGALRVPVF